MVHFEINLKWCPDLAHNQKVTKAFPYVLWEIGTLSKFCTKTYSLPKNIYFMSKPDFFIKMVKYKKVPTLSDLCLTKLKSLIILSFKKKKASCRRKWNNNSFQQFQLSVFFRTKMNSKELWKTIYPLLIGLIYWTPSSKIPALRVTSKWKPLNFYFTQGWKN